MFSYHHPTHPDTDTVKTTHDQEQASLAIPTVTVDSGSEQDIKENLNGTS